MKLNEFMKESCANNLHNYYTEVTLIIQFIQKTQQIKTLLGSLCQNIIVYTGPTLAIIAPG